MKAFSRIAAALGLVAVFGATAVFAQAPTMSPWPKPMSRATPRR